MAPLDAQWRDYSDFLVHLTRDVSPHTAFENMMSIYSERRLRAGRAFGIARNKAPASSPQEVVCFSEVPLHELGRVEKRRGPYGIGFRKEFIIEKGGCPVWYVPKDSPTADAIQALMSAALGHPTPGSESILRITPCIDFPGDYPNRPYHFEWEREWRLPGDLQFRETDVTFLIIPEESHGAAWSFFEMDIRTGSGPGYLCPYIDPYWDWERVQKALSAG